MCRSLDNVDGKVTVHLVNAFSAYNHLALWPVKNSDKSNEITAIPELLQQLTLSRNLTTQDAMRYKKKNT
ncbi:hypothetical protein G0S15_003644 [Salmonella enterica]|nr:hypothetical protein [Salmonella enterica]